jgi:hypothetical protein
MRQKTELGTKKCELCNATMRPLQGDTPFKFGKRRFCSDKCRRTHAASMRVYVREPLPKKNCKTCGKPLEIRETERPNAFKKREYCGHSCASQAKKTAFPKRTYSKHFLDSRCWHCNARLPKSKHRDKAIQRRLNTTKKFCGSRCSLAFTVAQAERLNRTAIDKFLYGKL